ncbi:MAG: TatD family hydrolase [Bacteroidales bacterium]
MPYFNLHTHRTDSGNDPDTISIYNATIQTPELSAPFSVGIHPWHLTEENYQPQLQFIASLRDRPGFAALGECGLDKVCATPLLLQLKAFREMVRLSELYGKPLILHCVKAFDELLQVRKELHPRQPWIIHGFRGKPELAEQLVRHGISLSFGARFNPETVKRVPVDNLFLETDESELPISLIYQQVASLKQISVESLEKVINNRAQRMFDLGESQFIHH